MMERSSTINVASAAAAIKEDAANVHPAALAQFAAQMGAELLGGNRGLSKIPSDYFQK